MLPDGKQQSGALGAEWILSILGKMASTFQGKKIFPMPTGQEFISSTKILKIKVNKSR